VSACLQVFAICFASLEAAFLISDLLFYIFFVIYVLHLFLHFIRILSSTLFSLLFLLVLFCSFFVARMSGKFDFLADAVPGRISWRFKVRIARLWEVPAYLRPDVVNSLEMVLVDSKVCYRFFLVVCFV
jgi:hypothetical protein